MRQQWWILVLIVLSLATAGPAPADCGTAKDLYEKALDKSDLSARIRLLEKAAAECEDFSVVLALGRAYEADGQLEKAKTAYLDAEMLAEGGKSLAKVYARLGGVYENMGEEEASLRSYRKATDLHRTPALEGRLRDIRTRRMGKGLSADQIVRALAIKDAFGVDPADDAAPSVDLYVHFEYDKADLNSKGREQADELGKALTDPALDGARFVLVGHTDRVASHAYNDRLSLQRAMSVKAYLVRHFSISPDRIRVIGRGERDLLYRGDSEQDHALNRRVEIRVE